MSTLTTSIIAALSLQLFVPVNASEGFARRNTPQDHIAGNSVKPCEAGSARMVADLEQSMVRWTGTKIRGKHEGTVTLQSGELCIRQSRIVRAGFVADMRSIRITDIPEHETVPRKLLRDHLTGETFFDVERYPQAVLTINEVRHEDGSTYAIDGTLTMRGVNRLVSFQARVPELSSDRVTAHATLKVDRTQWGMRYRFADPRGLVVDDEFTLDLTLVARPDHTAR